MPTTNLPATPPAPSVRPLGSVDWTAKDARWLAGGRRLQLVLAVALIGLTFAPVRILEHRPPPSTMPTQPSAVFNRPVVEREGVHWPWSAPTYVSSETTASELSDRPDPTDEAIDRWTQTIAPVAVAMLLIVGLLLPRGGRAFVQFLAGCLLLALLRTSDGFPPWRVNLGGVDPLMFSVQGWYPPWWYEAPSLATQGRIFSLFLILLAVGGCRAGWRGGPAGVRRVAALVPALPAFLPLLVELLRIMARGNPEVLLKPAWVPTMGPADWAMRIAELGFMACWLLVGLVALINAVAGDRRVAAGGFWCGWAMLALGAAAVLGRAAMRAWSWGDNFDGGAFDRMLGLGEPAHQMVATLAGAALIIGGSARLWVHFTRPRLEPPGDTSADVPTDPPPVSTPPQKGGPHA